MGGDDMQEGMQCSSHPLRNNGGICAFCLQEKLGKLISSSSNHNTRLFPSSSSSSIDPSPLYPPLPISSSSSSSPNTKPAALETHLPPLKLHFPLIQATKTPNNNSFLTTTTTASASDKKTITTTATATASAAAAAAAATASCSSAVSEATLPPQLIMKRSKSVAARRVFDGDDPPRPYIAENSPRRKSFWSFLHFARKRRSSDPYYANKKQWAPEGRLAMQGGCATVPEAPTAGWVMVSGKENESPNGGQPPADNLDRKVARSRSVGCGSRSFSGEFLEKLSTGFVDCTLRRVESQREAKQPHNYCNNNNNNNKIVLHGSREHSEEIKDRVRCGGLFGGFGGSSSSSSSYWISDEHLNNGSSNRISGPPHSRSKSWGWAFASPIRAFRPSSSSATKLPNRRDEGNVAHVAATPRPMVVLRG